MAQRSVCGRTVPVPARVTCVHNGAMADSSDAVAPDAVPPEESTAARLAGYLHAVGVRHVFGYPGESVIDFMEAARHQGIEVVSAVREGTAAFMAEAAAMVTGLPGACLSTLGRDRRRC